MPQFFSSALSRFAREERGSVAIIFGLASIPLLLMSGIAVDYARMVDMREKISAAVDSASLAAGRALIDGTLSDDQIRQLATKYFDGNAARARKMGSIAAPEIAIDRPTGTVTIKVNAKLALTVGRLSGLGTFAVPVTSTAVYAQRDIEVGMALDITGSMGDRIGGERKIDALKTAFEQFADRLIPAQASSSHRVRIGLAPYSAAINLGGYADRASSNRSKDNCVTESKNSAATDARAAFYVKGDGSKDVDSTEGRNDYVCPGASITPLSDDRDALIRTVDRYDLSASTGGHFGVQWAWNLVSDQWASVWGSDGAPESYSLVKKGKLMKAVVLMTDGIFNTSFHGKKSSDQAIALCDAMKQKGVVVFAVGFGLGGDQTALNTLKACATPGAGYFADASSPEELQAAFSQFAAKLSELRITQ